MTNTQNHIINKLVVLSLLSTIICFSCKQIKNNIPNIEEETDNYIQFDDFSINNIIISESYYNLIKKYGEPDKSYDLLLITDRYSLNKKKYNVPVLVYQNNGLEYFHFKDSIQLYSVNFDLCKNINISLYGRQLNRNTSTKKFCKHYNIGNDYITAIDANWTHYPDINHGYEFLWMIDSVNGECMEFFFDGNKKLKYINFGLKNGGIL